jgi:hypothetical protein
MDYTDNILEFFENEFEFESVLAHDLQIPDVLVAQHFWALFSGCKKVQRILVSLLNRQILLRLPRSFNFVTKVDRDTEQLETLICVSVNLGFLPLYCVRMDCLLLVQPFALLHNKIKY